MKKKDVAVNPTNFLVRLKPYDTVSHKVWDYIYMKNSDKIKTVLKLDWNESTVLPDFILKKILKYLISQRIHLNWYPDVNNLLLLNKLGRYASVSVKQVQYFNGSDGALEYVARAYISPGDKVIIISPTYDNFRVYVESCGANVVRYFNRTPFEKNIYNLIHFINIEKPKIVYLVNPNNPTGVLYSESEVKRLLQKFPKVLFVIDEAYYEFCGRSCVSLIKQFNNVIISRSFTKAFGLGAFRLGYLVANEEIISNLNKIRVGKNVNTFAQVAGIVALDNINYMYDYVNEVRLAKKMVVEFFKKIKVDVKNTPANFILLRCKDPKLFLVRLEQVNVFVRDRSSDPQLSGYVRITIGDLKTMKEFILRLKEILRNKYESGLF